ncbi:ANTAR domain-containing protein [Streptomyces griseoviridis]|uniref:ANTAR domain-containing protein n=1 Tax=Streptomyces griseoviridis TaxID=45398 RepID=UPI003447249F
MAERSQVISDGMADLLRSLRLEDGGGDAPAAACARALGAAGVAVSVLVGEDRVAELLWSHPAAGERFENLQFTVGEGPGPDALRAGVPVVEPDLDRVRPERWPALLPGARELGVHGVCCFPLGVGAIRLGVLTVLCDEKRHFSDQQFDDAQALAAALTCAVLNGGLTGAPSAPGALPGPVGLNRAAVHQATGMISVQLGVPLAEALLRLRAHAYGSGRDIGEVAAEVVTRTLRFDDDGTGPNSPDRGKG